MKESLTFRSIVFKRAYAIVSNAGCRFSEALSEAWRIYRLKKVMKKKPVSFSYMTKNGKVREAIGTINTTKAKTNREPNYSVVTYFDLKAQAIRCFKAENLIGIAV